MHLRKLRLKVIGTIRVNRVKQNVIDKRAPRGEYVVKHEKNNGMKCITVVDSNPVSIVSTAVEVTSLLPSKRYSSQTRSKNEITFLVICNAAGDGNNKVETKEFAVSIAKSYMRKIR